MRACVGESGGLLLPPQARWTVCGNEINNSTQLIPGLQVRSLFHVNLPSMAGRINLDGKSSSEGDRAVERKGKTKVVGLGSAERWPWRYKGKAGHPPSRCSMTTRYVCSPCAVDLQCL